MNCKPGDLAIIVRAYCPENVGLLVLVCPEWASTKYGHTWLTRSARPTPTVWSNDMIRGSTSTLGYVPDAWLRPIRDPGEDATDETLAWLPVRTTRESEPA